MPTEEEDLIQWVGVDLADEQEFDDNEAAQLEREALALAEQDAALTAAQAEALAAASLVDQTIREDRARAELGQGVRGTGNRGVGLGGQQSTTASEQASLSSDNVGRLWATLHPPTNTPEPRFRPRPNARFTLDDAVRTRPDEARAVTPSKRGKNSGPQYNRIRFASSLEGDK